MLTSNFQEILKKPLIYQKPNVANIQIFQKLPSPTTEFHQWVSRIQNTRIIALFRIRCLTSPNQNHSKIQNKSNQKLRQWLLLLFSFYSVYFWVKWTNIFISKSTRNIMAESMKVFTEWPCPALFELLFGFFGYILRERELNDLFLVDFVRKSLLRKFDKILWM